MQPEQKQASGCRCLQRFAAELLKDITRQTRGCLERAPFGFVRLAALTTSVMLSICTASWRNMDTGAWYQLRNHLQSLAAALLALLLPAMCLAGHSLDLKVWATAAAGLLTTITEKRRTYGL